MLVIAHRLGAIENTDKVFLIEDGKVVEEGHHLVLLRKKAKYYKLQKF